MVANFIRKNEFLKSSESFGDSEQYSCIYTQQFLHAMPLAICHIREYARILHLVGKGIQLRCPSVFVFVQFSEFLYEEFLTFVEPKFLHMTRIF